MLDIERRLRRVAFIVCDFDGVFTDGGLHFDGEGRPFRTVNARDVTALTLWHLSGGKSALVSGLGCKALEVIAETWKCSECHMWVKDKRRVCREMSERQGVALEQFAFFGDDIIDVKAMQAVGLAVAPADAEPPAKEAAHLVTERPGGRGALRELVHRVLEAQGRLAQTLEAYTNRKDGVQ